MNNHWHLRESRIAGQSGEGKENTTGLKWTVYKGGFRLVNFRRFGRTRIRDVCGLLHSDRFGQIARLVHVTTSLHGNVIG